MTFTETINNIEAELKKKQIPYKRIGDNISTYFLFKEDLMKIFAKYGLEPDLKEYKGRY